MKIRSCFVSNSSSANFIIQTNCYNERQLISTLNGLVAYDEKWNTKEILKEIKEEIKWIQNRSDSSINLSSYEETYFKYEGEIKERIKGIISTNKKIEELRLTFASQRLSAEERVKLNELEGIKASIQEALDSTLTYYLLWRNHIEVQKDSSAGSGGGLLLKKYFSIYNGVEDFSSYLKEVVATLTVLGIAEELRVEDNNDGSADGVPIIRIQQIEQVEQE